MCLIKRAGHWENDDQLRQDKVEKRSGKKTGAIKKSDVPGMPGGMGHNNLTGVLYEKRSLSILT